MRNRMEERWLALWRRVGAQGDPYEIYADLEKRYAEPHRAYHTFVHIERCLDELEQCRYLLINPDAVEWAIWFHDAIYDLWAADNEEKSAVLAVRAAVNALLPYDFRRGLTGLILATKHIAIPTNSDAGFIVDIDLAGFGKTWEEFAEDGRLIREEYELVPEEEFNAGRSAILGSFIRPKRLAIYLTRFFREKYEAQAQRNLARSIAELSGN